MLLFSEQHKLLDHNDVKAKLLDLDDVPVPTEEQVNAALGDYYNRSLQLQASHLQFTASLAPPPGAAVQAAFLPGLGKKILTELKKIVCMAVNDKSTEGEIVDAIMNALASLMPGGVLIESLAKLLIKYILSLGIVKFCPTAPAGK